MEGGEIKVSWTNALKDMSDEELAYMQGQRHWIGRGFQDAKSQLGMADYEVRKWWGWHHHMAMAALAMLFLLKERVEHETSAPLISARYCGTAGVLPSPRAAERKGGDGRPREAARTTPAQRREAMPGARKESDWNRNKVELSDLSPRFHCFTLFNFQPISPWNDEGRK